MKIIVSGYGLVFIIQRNGRPTFLYYGLLDGADTWNIPAPYDVMHPEFGRRPSPCTVRARDIAPVLRGSWDATLIDWLGSSTAPPLESIQALILSPDRVGVAFLLGELPIDDILHGESQMNYYVFDTDIADHSIQVIVMDDPLQDEGLLVKDDTGNRFVRFAGPLSVYAPLGNLDALCNR